MAPVFLYNARNYFIDNTKIFMGGCVNIQFLPTYKGMTTAEYRYSHRENLVRTRSNSMRPLLACLEGGF